MSSSIATSTIAPRQCDAFLFCDLELTGSGVDKTRNCIIGGAMCVIEADALQTLLTTVDDRPAFRAVNDAQELLQLVPEENRFREYIHDQAALDEIDSFLSKSNSTTTNTPVLSIWPEEKGREFWLSETRTDMLRRAITEMRASTSDARTFTERNAAWLTKMTIKYPNLLPVSDTSNFDWAWLDHYRNTYGITTVNFANPK
jgi:hypothetical protein